LGSCVSRDIFNYNYNYKNQFDIVKYSARHSFASMFSEPFEYAEYAKKLPSKFQTNMVTDDLMKNIVNNLSNEKYDILLIDFIDERLNIIIKNDKVATKSTEFINTGILEDIIIDNEILSMSKEFIDYWESGWIKFIQLMKDIDCVDKIVLNKVYWCQNTSSGENYLPEHSSNKIDEMNNFLRTLYKIAEKNIPSNHIIGTDHSLNKCADTHQWGKAPFHYTESYYKNALTSLEEIVKIL
jgi:hypothetical protein